MVTYKPFDLAYIYPFDICDTYLAIFCIAYGFVRRPATSPLVTIQHVSFSSLAHYGIRDILSGVHNTFAQVLCGTPNLDD